MDRALGNLLGGSLHFAFPSAGEYGAFVRFPPRTSYRHATQRASVAKGASAIRAGPASGRIVLYWRRTAECAIQLRSPLSDVPTTGLGSARPARTEAVLSRHCATLPQRR